MDQGHRISGVYMVSSDNQQYVPILCDMETASGGWTVIQQRVDGSIPFNHTWNSYKLGFGDFSTNFWFGNDRIHNLTTHYGESSEILFDLTKHDGTKVYTAYKDFNIDDESNKYQLHVGSVFDPQIPGGGAVPPGENKGFDHQNGQYFSTLDMDNDSSGSRHCSEEHKGSGWWFASCYKIHLNGIYGLQGSDGGIVWDKVTFIAPFSGGSRVQHPFIKTRMLVRRND
eukprot:TCONS_00031044-protein